MKQLVILSGKGGTGKTSLVAAYAHLLGNESSLTEAVFVDADVDAANLSLLVQPNIGTPQEFWGGSEAWIDPDKCNSCGMCETVCRYDAILHHKDKIPAYCIDPIACDGCAACVYACKQNAICMGPRQEGFWYQSQSPFGTLFHAELFPGRENSGKLVTLVKQQARVWAEEHQIPLVIIDGPPGIGCPVISACAGSELGLVVTEPGVAGFHDLKRILGTLQHFHIPPVICINKADIYPPGTQKIREFAATNKIDIIGEIPFDEQVPNSILLGTPVTVAFPQSAAAKTIRTVFLKTMERL